MLLIFILLIVFGFILYFEYKKRRKRNMYIQDNTLHIQFSSQNFPSHIYKDMFTQGTPWIGGYELGSGKTKTVNKRNI